MTQVMRQYLIEQIDDAAVVQYYADGFEKLPLDQKILVWHLAQAALAGRDIYYDQRYAPALDMRRTLEAILRVNPPEASKPGTVKPRTRNPEPETRNPVAELRRYTKLFWINSGPHNSLTARKFVLECTPAELRDAAHAAAAKGAIFPSRPGETLDQLLDRLEGPFFDPTVDPLVTSKAPGIGRDILGASANNLYAGVTMADVDGFEERYGLNSRLARQHGRLIEEVYRVGGKYGDAIARVIGHLRAALPYAPAPMRAALDALIRFYETGEDADREAYDIAWVKDADSPIDTINGFVETYLDARGVKGAWEALVYYVNHEKTASLQRLAAEAPWFEARMPWDPQWRRQDVVGVSARAIDVVAETGEAGPVTAIGINLPNDQRIRETYGSKSVSLANINEAYDKSQLPAYRQEFCWSDDEVARAEKWGALASEVTTAIHEVLGHGSGRVAPHLNGQPQLALKEQYSAIEEARADLVALYWMPDPKTADVGLLPAEHQDEIVRTEYEAYTRNALVQLRRVREGTTIEEDHMRNRQLIVHWLLANARAIETREREGKTFYVMVDAAAFREGCGRLLAEVQRIKSEGDYAAARALFEAHGIHFEPALRDEIVRRVDRLNLPSYTGFVQPKLEPVTDEAGQITDVRISYPQDLERQMLEYAEVSART
jgi:dipeptidyl-peptidase-3